MKAPSHSALRASATWLTPVTCCAGSGGSPRPSPDIRCFGLVDAKQPVAQSADRHAGAVQHRAAVAARCAAAARSWRQAIGASMPPKAIVSVNTMGFAGPSPVPASCADKTHQTGMVSHMTARSSARDDPGRPCSAPCAPSVSEGGPRHSRPIARKDQVQTWPSNSNHNAMACGSEATGALQRSSHATTPRLWASAQAAAANNADAAAMRQPELIDARCDRPRFRGRTRSRSCRRCPRPRQSGGSRAGLLETGRRSATGQRSRWTRRSRR